MLVADIASRVDRVRQRVAKAAVRSGRAPESVQIVAVAKTFPAELIVKAAHEGLTDFGENYVQEAAAKIPLVRQQVTTPLRWHMVGHLQTNKVKAALELFDIIQSADSLKLAQAIGRRSTPHRAPVLIEVYYGSEAERPGFRPFELQEAIGQLKAEPGLEVLGLMTVPPLGLSEEETRVVFRRLAAERQRLESAFADLHLEHLSMGMTEDFEAAIEEGATIVRIGRAIFGERS